MKTLRSTTSLLASVLLLGLSFSTLNAEGMKCGAGKCGSAMMPAKEKKEKEVQSSDINTTYKFGTIHNWDRGSYRQIETQGKIRTH